MIGKSGQLALWIVLLPLALGAQSEVPAPASGERPTLAFRSGPNHANTLRGGISVEAVFDDNAFARSTNRVSDLSYGVGGRLAFNQVRPRLLWNLTYSPTFFQHQRLAQRDQLSHALGFEFQGQVTRRLTLRFRDAFHITTNPFDRLDQDLQGSEFGVLDRPNDAVVTPLARRIANFASLDLTFQTTRRSAVGVAGTFGETRFRDLGSTTDTSNRLLEGRSLGGRVFFLHRPSRRHSFGPLYQFFQFVTRDRETRTVAHSLYYFHSFLLRPDMNLSFFGGPEYSRTHGQVVLSLDFFGTPVPFRVSTFNAMWSWTGGLSYGWRREFTSFRADAVRRVSDGGGLIGPTRLHQASVGMRRQLTRAWTFDLGADYSQNQALNVARPNFLLKTLSARSGLSRRLGENVSLRLDYSRVHQIQEGSLFAERRSNHNRASVSLTYEFTRPFGR